MLFSRKAKCIFAFILLITFMFDMSVGFVAKRFGMPAAEFYMSTVDVLSSEYRAQRGDADAIEKLGWYHGVWNNDSEKQLHWWSVGASHNIPRYQFLFGKTQLLMGKDRELAILWIRKSASSNYKPAQKFLEDTNE